MVSNHTKTASIPFNHHKRERYYKNQLFSYFFEHYDFIFHLTIIQQLIQHLKAFPSFELYQTDFYKTALCAIFKEKYKTLR